MEKLKNLPYWFMLGCMICMMEMQAQDNQGYQTPPKDIVDLVDSPLTPLVSTSPNGTHLILLERPGFPSIEEVAQPELRLAGLRIKPSTNGGSRDLYYTGLGILDISTGKGKKVAGLPEMPRIGNVSWSNNGKFMAFTMTVEYGIELWVADVETGEARSLTGPVINDIGLGSTFIWMPDNENIVFKRVVPNRSEPPKKDTPKGPTIQSSDGVAAAVRTYQDLLKNAYDESQFEYFATSQLMKIGIRDGKLQEFQKPGIISDFSSSPDGNYLLVETIHRPFSYLVPASLFPKKVEIYDQNGTLVKQLADIPLAENIPTGFDAVRQGPRSYTWRADKPATLCWVEAKDEGNPKKEASIRDQMYILEAPFQRNAIAGPAFSKRFAGTLWGDDGLAISYERWRANRKVVAHRWSPQSPSAALVTVFDYSSEDSYVDPGSFETVKNKYGRDVLLRSENGKLLYLTGIGASPEGNRPFFDELDVTSGKTNRMWRSASPYYEVPVAILDVKSGVMLTRRESEKEPPNYFTRNLKNGQLKQLTQFENPYKALEGVKKEVVKYKRKDGVELMGTLYMPSGYDQKKDGALPVFMWAYPREFKTADAAGQVKGSPYEFIRLNWGSPIYWVTQGYAVFDDFAMPIIGEAEEEPNDSFVAQLSDGAEAAVNKLVSMGVADKNRIGVGGHSYGAFMTANLLAHTDLFAAGIARSGAYNRTLTPFGFQAEERTFWEAKEVYATMSPFFHADKIKEPILLVHGEADNNSGTFPIQSERFYAALKGHGATARLVQLPAESHGYRGRESILHTLWEMNTWLDKHVKNKGKQGARP